MHLECLMSAWTMDFKKSYSKQGKMGIKLFYITFA